MVNGARKWPIGISLLWPQEGLKSGGKYAWNSQPNGVDRGNGPPDRGGRDSDLLSFLKEGASIPISTLFVRVKAVPEWNYCRLLAGSEDLTPWI